MRNEPHHPDASLEPIAFFCRAKPQNADALQIFKCARRVFIGHPLLRNGEPYDPSALRRCLVNPTCPDEEWAREIELQSTTQHYNKNRNFIREVTPGSIVVIPRPEQGAVYAGRIIGSFEIVDSPPWADAYLALRAEQKVNIEDKEKPHIADVAQGWPVDEYRRIYLSRLPGWLRHSMFGRPTFGRFQNHPINGTTAHDMMAHILDGGSTIPVSWTLELDKIKCRLVDTLTASAFEHLVVSLLQLERPNEIWYQAGGPGDGGIDGFGSNEEGEVVGLMQAKLYAQSAPELRELGHTDRQIERYVAVLVLERPVQPTDGTKLLNLEWIANAVHRHWRTLPQARAMRVGEQMGDGAMEG